MSRTNILPVVGKMESPNSTDHMTEDEMNKVLEGYNLLESGMTKKEKEDMISILELSKISAKREEDIRNKDKDDDISILPSSPFLRRGGSQTSAPGPSRPSPASPVIGLASAQRRRPLRAPGSPLAVAGPSLERTPPGLLAMPDLCRKPPPEREPPARDSESPDALSVTPVFPASPATSDVPPEPDGDGSPDAAVAASSVREATPLKSSPEKKRTRRVSRPVDELSESEEDLTDVEEQFFVNQDGEKQELRRSERAERIVASFPPRDASPQTRVRRILELLEEEDKEESQLLWSDDILPTRNFQESSLPPPIADSLLHYEPSSDTSTLPKKKGKQTKKRPVAASPTRQTSQTQSDPDEPPPSPPPSPPPPSPPPPPPPAPREPEPANKPDSSRQHSRAHRLLQRSIAAKPAAAAASASAVLKPAAAASASVVLKPAPVKPAVARKLSLKLREDRRRGAGAGEGEKTSESARSKLTDSGRGRRASPPPLASGSGGGSGAVSPPPVLPPLPDPCRATAERRRRASSPAGGSQTAHKQPRLAAGQIRPAALRLPARKTLERPTRPVVALTKLQMASDGKLLPPVMSSPAGESPGAGDRPAVSRAPTDPSPARDDAGPSTASVRTALRRAAEKSAPGAGMSSGAAGVSREGRRGSGDAAGSERASGGAAEGAGESQPAAVAGAQKIIVTIACPLCAACFPRDKIEAHASACEGNDVLEIEESPSPPSPPIRRSTAVYRTSRARTPGGMQRCRLCQRQFTDGPDYLEHVDLCVQQQRIASGKEPP